jgi:hypothetical protein
MRRKCSCSVTAGLLFSNVHGSFAGVDLMMMLSEEVLVLLESMDVTRKSRKIMEFEQWTKQIKPSILTLLVYMVKVP